MLEVIDRLKASGIITYQQEFCDALDLPKQNIYKIRIGLQHFTAEHIRAACEAFGINANWIMGVEKRSWLSERSAKKFSRKTYS